MKLQQITSEKHAGAKKIFTMINSCYNLYFLYFLAMAVYARSPSAYAALKNLEIIQLPCEKQVKKKMNANSMECGIDEKAIEQEVTKYEEFVTIQQQKKKPKPMKVGVLIFDETKVQSKIMFNMTGNKVMGFAMTPDELPFLHDIFSSLDQESEMKTSYVLQFIWRDLTSSYSIIGPYFNCAKSWDHSFLYDCVMRTLKVFSLYHFRVKAMVCDGASSNLSLLKVLSEYKRTQLPLEAGDNNLDQFLPRMKFTNPYDPGSDADVFMIICPSHQVIIFKMIFCKMKKFLGKNF